MKRFMDFYMGFAALFAAAICFYNAWLKSVPMAETLGTLCTIGAVACFMPRKAQ